MAITNAGAVLAAICLMSDSPTPLNNANAYLGVGDSTTAFSAAHTDLQAATNKLRVGQDTSYPQRSSNVLTYRSTYTTGQANYHWQEWGLFNASSSGTMFSRKVEDLGTKTSAQTWQLTVTLTIQAA